MGGTPVPGLEKQQEIRAKVQQDKEEIERLRRPNPVYKEYSSDWKLYLAAYEGGKDFANRDNLFRHVRENEQDFADRVERIHYLNYCAPLVDFFTNFIFSETIQRDGGNNREFYDEFVKDVDKLGNKISDFMRNVSDDDQIYGMLYVLVDSPPQPQDREVVTQQDQVDRGLRPYWVLIPPDEILDWVADEFDNLIYAKRRQFINTVGSDMLVHSYEKYTEWVGDSIRISMVNIDDPSEPQLEPQQTIGNALREVPLVPFRFKRSKKNKWMGNSFLRDLAYNSREVMNLTSLLQEFLYRQCFNVLVKQVDDSIPAADQDEGNIGSSNVVEYPKEATAPSYLSPPSDPAQFMQGERQNIINQMFKLAAQDTMNELFNGEKRSGFSQSVSFSRTVPFIADRAETLERGENRLMALTMKYKGRTWDGTIKYKDRYEITNITDAITQLTSLLRDLFMPSETFAKAELKRLVHEYDGKISPEQMKKIEDEIDKLDWAEWQEVQRAALVGRGTSPAEQQESKSTGTMEEVAGEAQTLNTAATKRLKSNR